MYVNSAFTFKYLFLIFDYFRVSYFLYCFWSGIIVQSYLKVLILLFFFFIFLVLSFTRAIFTALFNSLIIRILSVYSTHPQINYLSWYVNRYEHVCNLHELHNTVLLCGLINLFQFYFLCSFNWWRCVIVRICVLRDLYFPLLCKLHDICMCSCALLILLSILYAYYDDNMDHCVINFTVSVGMIFTWLIFRYKLSKWKESRRYSRYRDVTRTEKARSVILLYLIVFLVFAKIALFSRTDIFLFFIRNTDSTGLIAYTRFWRYPQNY